MQEILFALCSVLLYDVVLEQREDPGGRARNWECQESTRTSISSTFSAMSAFCVVEPAVLPRCPRGF